jgi:hypothetical protein
MCMSPGCTGSKPKGSSQSYSPKSAAAPKAYKHRNTGSNSGNRGATGFGTPKVKVSFGTRKGY